jgi:RNA polymerase sigma-70 factor (ECF subfamily)
MGEACLRLAAHESGDSAAVPDRRERARSSAPAEASDEASDEALLAALGARHPTLARQFVRRFQASVYGVAYTIVRDVALAQDIAQQAFEHAWLRADMYDPRRGSVRGWLLRITHNLAIDAVRIRRPTPVDPQDLHALLGQIMLGQIMHSPEQEVLSAEAAASVRAALAGLPIRQARAVIMAVGYGMTAQEIADYEHVPLGTTKYRIRSGLIKLHGALSKPGDRDE